jgi:hypothetical protein
MMDLLIITGIIAQGPIQGNGVSRMDIGPDSYLVTITVNIRIYRNNVTGKSWWGHCKDQRQDECYGRYYLFFHSPSFMTKSSSQWIKD